MGRRKSKWPDLPPRMTAREGAEGLLYYYQAAGKKIPLGSDLGEALKEWAKLEAGNMAPKLFPEVTKLYRASVFEHFALSTKEHYETALRNLDQAFHDYTLEQIEPVDIKKYIRLRTKKGAALFEKRVCSAFYEWARGEGHTSAPNPCVGVKFTAAERKSYGRIGRRTRYVTDAEFDEVYAKADELVQDAMDLALYTGQRPGDLLAARRQDIIDGTLWFTQEKTGTRIGIRIEGELDVVLRRILTRPRAVPSMYLLSDRRGQRVLYNTLNRRFIQARGEADWQFRDIRAKTATDSPDLKRAQELLGHSQETTTVIYRRAKSNVVAPLKRANSEPN